MGENHSYCEYAVKHVRELKSLRIRYLINVSYAIKPDHDQVVRINKTFTFDLARGDFPIEPIMSGKKLILISSSGEFGFEIGGIREKMNYLAPHVETAGKYLGVGEFYEIKSEYQEFADARHEESLSNAYKGVEELVKQLA